MRLGSVSLATMLAGVLLSTSVHALETPLVELKLVAEHPVNGMTNGHLSGLARCADEWLAVSDRDDDRLYRLQEQEGAWLAEAQTFEAPPPPPSGLPWGLRMRTWAAGLVRGGDLDFEGLACDNAGNRYLVSEAHAAVLQITPGGTADWLNLPASLIRQARASGMLLHFNALLEGIAIDPAGERMWLAAERERRGLLVLHKKNNSWRCAGSCVLLSQAGQEPSLSQPDRGISLPRDFADVSYFNDKLFTLERGAYRICRRNLADGKLEKCWSFAAEALTDARRYPVAYGMAEALWLDDKAAWIGLDNGGKARGDGENRPIVWHFAAPKGGWNAP